MDKNESNRSDSKLNLLLVHVPHEPKQHKHETRTQRNAQIQTIQPNPSHCLLLVASTGKKKNSLLLY